MTEDERRLLLHLARWVAETMELDAAEIGTTDYWPTRSAL
jgi:hypothetical protein